MYKDVRKKITWRKVLAVVVAICLIVTVVQLPDITAKAEDGVVYHDYTYSAANQDEQSTIEEKTVASVFTINQNENAGAEQLYSISFDLSKLTEETSTDTASVAVYLNPTDPLNPTTTGTYFCQTDLSNELVEGTNTVELSTGLASLEAGTVVEIVITLNGDDFLFYENTSTEEGNTYVQTTDGWVDAASRNQCIDIAMKTTDVADDTTTDDTASTDDTTTDETSTTSADTTSSDDTTTDDTSTDDTTTDETVTAEDVESEIAVMSDDEDYGIMMASSDPYDLSSDLTSITVIGNASATSTTPTIQVTYNGTELYENIDYTCSVTTYNGSRLVVITGMGNYTGSNSTTYTISDNDISSVVTATGYTIPDQTYTGSAVTLSDSIISQLYTITDSSAIAATDLNVTYINNVNAGTATVVISPKTTTSYGGSITATFTIAQVDIYGFASTAFSYDTSVTYVPNGTAEAPTVTITYNGMTLVEDTDYTITTSGFDTTGTNVGNIEINAVAGSNYKTSSPKHLYVTVNQYSLSNSEITIEGVDASYDYTGSSISPTDLKMLYNGEVIYSSTVGTSDFTVTYSNNTAYGTATGRIFAKDGTNYTGVKTFTFEIVKRALSTTNITVTHDDTDDYTPTSSESALTTFIAGHTDLLAVKLLGSSAVTFTDEITLKDNVTNTTLTYGTDYSVTYQYNSAASKSTQLAQVTFTGKNNYSGSFSRSFLIVKDISTTTISVPTSLAYQGTLDGAIIPSVFTSSQVVITNGSSNTLTVDSDYSLEYEDNNVGVTDSATLKIQGLGAVTTSGCYVGNTTKTFKVTAKSIGDDDVTATIQDVNYAGGSTTKNVATTVELTDITVEFNGSTLTGGEGYDYTVDATSYKNNTAPGTATVTLSGSGNFTGTKTVSFNILGEDISGYTVSSIENMTYTGSSIVPSFTVTADDAAGTVLVKNTDYTVSYKNDSTGTESTTITDAGTYTIIITAKSGSIYSGSIEVSNFKVYQQSIADEDAVTFVAISDQAYTSDEITPTVTLRNKTTTKNLTLNTDYTISNWTNNITVGTATATVTGTGNYTGTRSVSFNVTQKDVSDTSAIKFSTIEKQPYIAGTPSTPYFTLTYTVGTTTYTLIKDTDYTVEYSNNDKIGTGKITVTGIGNFTGTRTTTFTILASIKETCDVTFTNPTGDDGSYAADYTGSAMKPGVTVKLKAESGGTTLTQGKDYTVAYTDNTNAGTATITVTGMGSYTDSVPLTFTINSVDIENVAVTLAKTSYTYTGSQIQPVISSVKYGTYTLNSNDPYTVTYGDNVNQGAGTLTLTPETDGNFYGTKTVGFEIDTKSIGSGTTFASGISMDTIDVQDYSGAVIWPEPGLYYKVSSDTTIEMALNSEYSISYPDENSTLDYIDPGTYSIKFTGTGNYSGEVTKTFTIARSIEDGTIDGVVDMEYTGSAITQADLKVYLPNLLDPAGDPELLDSSNYTVTYSANINAGEVTVTVTGNTKNYYKGTLETTFKIIGNFADASTVIAAIDDIPRDPNNDGDTTYHPATLDITCGGNNLTNAETNENYTVTYSNDTKIGTASLVITGIGDYYTGTTEIIYYDIVPANDVFLIKYANADETTSDTGKIPDQTYCGSGITFDPTSEDFPFAVYYVNEAEGVTERLLTYGVDYELSYTNNTNANVVINDDGTLKVDDDGNYVNESNVATITISGIGKYKNSNAQTTTFTILPLYLSDLVIDDSDNANYVEGSEDEISPRTYTGNTITPSGIMINNVDAENNLICTLKLNTDYTLTPVTSIAVLDEEGNAVLDELGEPVVNSYTYEVGDHTACVTITGQGSNVIGSRTIEYDVCQKNIAETKIVTTAQDYTGYPLTPEVTVTNPTGDSNHTALTQNVDYFLEYENNTDAGTATVRVVANEDGNFTGSTEATFKINPLKISSTSIAIADIPDQAYSGSGVEPAVSIIYTDALGVPNTLVEGTDYTLAYANNTKAGTARVTVTGIGNYTSTSTKTFTITPCDIGAEDSTITIEAIENQAYTGSAVTPSLVMMDGEYQMKSGTDYTVSYTDNVQLGTATATIYGKGNYTGTRTATFQIASDISKATIGAGVSSEYTYTGSEICPVPVNVHIGSTTLTSGTNYTVSYEDNINAGTGTVILTGIGEYGGTLEKTFTINAKNISDTDVTLTGYSETAVYTESDVVLPIGITYGSNTLVENTDFVVSYSDNYNLGTASVTIVAVEGGNYTGTIEKTFEIVKKSVSDDDIVVSGMSSTYTYEGSEIAPVPTLTYGEDSMTADVDYTVTYANNNAVGVATMTITGIGKYQGTREVTYSILRKSVANCSVSSVSEQTYTGSDIEPTVTVTDGSKSLVEGTDYTLMYSNNRKAGTGSVIIAGKGNYTVTKTIRFNIRPGDIESLIVNATSTTSIGLSWTADGTATGYEIYRMNESGDFVRVARTRGTTYTETGLSSGTAYTYKVRAYLVTDDETYYSSFSSNISGTTNE